MSLRSREVAVSRDVAVTKVLSRSFAPRSLSA